MSFKGQLIKLGLWGDGVNFALWQSAARLAIGCHIQTDVKLAIGNSTTGITIDAATDRAISVYGTCSMTSGTAKLVDINHTQSAGSATIIEALRVSIDSEYRTGSWANAIVGRIDYGDAGDSAGGMAAAICAEMNMPAKDMHNLGGGYYAVDCEMNIPTDCVLMTTTTTRPAAFLNLAAWGGAVGEFDDKGFLFHTDGLTAAADHLLGAGSTSLRVNVEGTLKYIPLLPADGVSDAALNIGGTYNYGINFEAAPAVGANYSFINVGTYGAALAVALSAAHKFGVMHNVALTSSADYWYQAYYTKITTSGTTTLSSVAGHAYRMMIGSSLGAAYGVQCHMTLSGTIAISTEAISVSAYVNLASAAAVTTDRVCALQAMIEGAGGSVTGDQIVAYIVNAGTATTTDAIMELKNQSACTVTSGLVLDLDGTCTYAFDFDGTVADGWTSGDLTGADEYAAFDEYALIPVRVEGVTGTLYIMAAHTWKAVTV